MQLENKTFVDCIGRSRSTQYGKCEFTFGAIEEIEPQEFGEKIYLCLESPLIPLNDNFISAEKILQTEIIEKLGANFSLGEIFASGTEIENFVNVWGMKRPRVQALAAGSVFEIIANREFDKKILHEKLYSGFGIRTEEGFGQVRIWQPQNFTLCKFKENLIDKPKEFLPQTIEIAKNILLERYLEQLRIYAQEDAAALTAQLQRGNFTHFFSRLGDILSNVGKTNVRINFSEKIASESKDGSLFQDNLKKIYVGKQKLYDLLMGNAPLPYEGKVFLSNDKLCAEIGFKESDYTDKFCLEYLQNFLRAARKIAALKGGDGND